MHKARGLEDDPLSAASAGLFALKVPRARRISTLDLLGAMLDLADQNGHVPVDRPLYEVEQLLGMDAALESYEWLERLGVIARTASGWQIEAFAAHHGPAGATAASMAVLQRHLATVGAQQDNLDAVPMLAADAAAITPITVVPMKRWRRSLPMAAAGIAASVAVVAGVSQFVPQAAVTGRNAAVRAAAPTSIVQRGGVAGVVRTTIAAAAQAPLSPAVSAAPTASAVASPTTVAVGAPACLAPRVVTAITSVDLVPLPLSGLNGQTVWTAVVKGTATLTDSSQSLLLPGLTVVGHVLGGTTEPVSATLGSPLLLPNAATAFTAVVTLGTTKPASAVTATANATGIKTCP